MNFKNVLVYRNCAIIFLILFIAPAKSRNQKISYIFFRGNTIADFKTNDEEDISNAKFDSCKIYESEEIEKHRNDPIFEYFLEVDTTNMVKLISYCDVVKPRMKYWRRNSTLEKLFTKPLKEDLSIPNWFKNPQEITFEQCDVTWPPAFHENLKQNILMGKWNEIKRCFQLHSYCPVKIEGNGTRYNLKNPLSKTLSHCACEEELYRCMESLNYQEVDKLGAEYFTKDRKCIEEETSTKNKTVKKISTLPALFKGWKKYNNFFFLYDHTIVRFKKNDRIDQSKFFDCQVHKLPATEDLTHRSHEAIFTSLVKVNFTVMLDLIDYCDSQPLSNSENNLKDLFSKPIIIKDSDVPAWILGEEIKFHPVFGKPIKFTSDIGWTQESKWCGSEHAPKKYHDISTGRPIETIDRCCRKRHYCPIMIESNGTGYSIKNPTSQPIYHCSCESRFRDCLDKKEIESADEYKFNKNFENEKFLQSQCIDDKLSSAGEPTGQFVIE